QRHELQRVLLDPAAAIQRNAIPILRKTFKSHRVWFDEAPAPAQFLFEVIGITEGDSVISADIDKHSVSFAMKQEVIDKPVLGMLAVVTGMFGRGVSDNLAGHSSIENPPEIHGCLAARNRPTKFS